MSAGGKYIRELARQHWWIAPLALATVIGACWLGAILAKPSYLRWRSARALAQAREFLRQDDLQRAGVALQVAMRGQPSLALYQLVGDFDEAIGSVQAVEARRAACAMDPRDPGLELGLARTALRFGDLATARAALSAIEPGRQTALDYQRVAATYSMLAGDWTRAAKLLADIGKEAPTDAGIRLLDDSLLIRSPNLGDAAKARGDLHHFLGSPAQQLVALRVLLADAMSRHDPFAAGEAARALAAADNASFSDLLDAAAGEQFASPASGADSSVLAKIRAQASSNSAAAAQFGRRLLAEKHADEAAALIRELPPQIAAGPAIAELQTEIAAEREDWESLRRLLERGAWGPLPEPGSSFAFAARILRQNGNPALAENVWGEALRACDSSASALKALARLAEIWHWPDGMQEALFSAVHHFPDDEVAIQHLIGWLKASRNSQALLVLLTLRKDAHPLSDRQMGDWLLLSLLLSPRKAPDPLTAALESLYERNRTDPYLATDQAFALWQLGRVRESCAILDRLAPDDMLFPPRAPYLAIIYATAGRRQNAQAALIRTPPAAQLLPEEAELVARATAALRE